MDTLAKALERKRVQEGLSIAGMASRLGVSDSYLFLLRDGRRKPGVKFLRAIIHTFPDLQLMVFEYVARSEADSVDMEASDD